MKTLFHLICYLFLAATLHAEDWQTTNGQTYKDIRVLSHDTVFVTIMYADGGARIPLRTLPQGLQQRFGYDASAAIVEEAAVKAKELKDKEALITEQSATPQAVVHQDGVLIKLERYLQQFMPATATRKMVVKNQASPNNDVTIQNNDQAISVDEEEVARLQQEIDWQVSEYQIELRKHNHAVNIESNCQALKDKVTVLKNQIQSLKAENERLGETASN